MGVKTDLLAAASTFVAGDKVDKELDRFFVAEPDTPAAYDAINAVHTVVQFTSDPSGGNFTLTVTLRNGETFTTGNIAHNANAATIEGAIDTAATAAGITGWTNGDISVSGGTLLAAGADVVLTFDGDSVSGQNHTLTTLDGSGLTGGGVAADPVEKTTAGQSQRSALAVLQVLGVITDATPPEQTAITNFTKGSNLVHFPPWMIDVMAREAAFQDDNMDTYYAITDPVLGTDHRPSSLMQGQVTT